MSKDLDIDSMDFGNLSNLRLPSISTPLRDVWSPMTATDSLWSPEAKVQSLETVSDPTMDLVKCQLQLHDGINEYVCKRERYNLEYRRKEMKLQKKKAQRRLIG